MQLDQYLPFPFSYALWGHIIGGVLALLTFTLPLFSKKGGKLHLGTGWAYSIGMLIVAFSAFLITPWRYFFDPNRTVDSQSFSLFLFFIAAFALNSLQQGISVFKYKARKGPVKNLEALALPFILVLLSIIMLVYGIQLQKWLIIIFSVLGARVAFMQYKYWSQPPVHLKDWWFFHLENMFTCCIATVTAFIVTALPRIFPHISFDSVWMWLSPTILMVPWMIWFNKKYEKQFNVKNT